MRVAYFATNVFSPSVTFIVSQITGLLERGVDVQVFSGPARAGDLEHEDFRRYGLHERIHVWPAGMGPTFDRAVTFLSRRLRRSALPRLRPLLPYHDGRVALGLSRKAMALLAEPDFDVAVAHFGNVGLQVQKLRDLGALSAPLVTAFHAVDVSRFVARSGDDVYRPLFERGELMLPISDYCRRKLVELGCPEGKLVVHRMGIDLRQLEFQPRRVDEGAPVQLVSVARLTEKKGLRYAIEALASLRRERQDFHYHVVGEGPLRSTLEALIREHRLHSFVTLHGWMSRDQVTRLLRDMHVCLAPSVTASDGDQEGLPVAIMEAMAVGLPVISTWHAAIPELVGPATGLLVPERSPERLGEALREMLARRESWPEMGRRARAAVAECHDLEALNDTLLDRLRSLVPGDVDADGVPDGPGPKPLVET